MPKILRFPGLTGTVAFSLEEVESITPFQFGEDDEPKTEGSMVQFKSGRVVHLAMASEEVSSKVLRRSDP